MDKVDIYRQVEKPREFDPEGEFVLTPENVFILTS